MHFQLKKKKLIGRSGRYHEGKLAWRHQYSSRRHALLCSAMLAGWMDGSEAMLGSDQIGLDQIQFRKGSEHPTVWRKVPYKTIQDNKVIHICAKSIHIYKKQDFYSIQIQKLFFTFSFISSFQVIKFHVWRTHHFPGRRHDTGSFLYFQISVGNSMPSSAVSSIQCLDGSIIIISACLEAL